MTTAHLQRIFAACSTAAALVAALLLTATPAPAAKGGVKGKPAKTDHANQGQGHGQAPSEAPVVASTDSRAGYASARWFGRDDERAIRDWFSRSENLDGLPPGLAKRESLPPGLRRQLDRNGTLPPGLEAQLHPLPDALDRRLLRLPDGVRRVVVGRDVLLVEDRTNVIRDVLRNVLPALLR